MHKIATIILTKNEEIHIERAISSAKKFSNCIYIVDSGSVDRTVEIASSLGAICLHNNWINHATQFNWAIDQVRERSEWIFRLDADEFVDDELASEILKATRENGRKFDGFTVNRSMNFLGKPIKRGGLFPIKILRLFRAGKGKCEMKWMDEHLTVEGGVSHLSGRLIDDNLNSLTWWTEKHNNYSSREVVDIISREFSISLPSDTSTGAGREARIKRFLKDNVYAKLPIGVRPFMYFVYRYVIRMGFMDGFHGAAFHFLQGLWYRYLVDCKLYEVKAYMRKFNCDAATAVYAVLNIDIRLSGRI